MIDSQVSRQPLRSRLNFLQAPAIFEKRFARHYDSQGTDLQIPLAQDYQKRKSQQLSQESESLTRSDQESWDFFEQGDYSGKDDSIFGPDVLRPLRREFSTLNGDELFIAKHLKTLLANQSGPDPLKIVDAGGMFGLSWIKIAKRFEQEIADGKVEMIVTNLHFNPDRSKSNLKQSHGERYPTMPEEDYLFWQANRHLVQFLNCPVGQLPDNLDLLYESNSITYHSFIPAESRITLLTKLKPGGMLITQDRLGGTKLSGGLGEQLKADLAGFNQAVKASSQFKSHRSVSLKGQRSRIANDWRIITKGTGAKLAY